MTRKIRMGMVGGGHGAFIGNVHRMAARIDGAIELVCGAFSSDPERSLSSGLALGLSESRCYADFNQMLTAESRLPAGERMDFVSIVTPNHLHFDVAKAALESGFHVLSDKPATFSLNEALALAPVIAESGKLYGLTHTYTGYPMIKQAQALVASGELGKVVKVIAEYHQGWLASSEDDSGKQASWRVDPNQAGISCCMGDIGVHAANLMEYVTGLQITELCSDLAAVVSGRRLDDDGTVLTKFNNGARGTLMASQVAVGEENNLTLRVYGEDASLSWQQQEPNSLWLKRNNQPSQLYRTGVGPMADTTLAATRTPAGHPEGYLEAFANIYSDFAGQIIAHENNQESTRNVPGIDDAIRGMAFIENAVAASHSSIKWHPFVVDRSPFDN
ncbi:Gfo/Idh/MocA family oxidoreductase [Alteromonas sp. ASW11-36]|uniref:Gfo/Idh/MocA family oxidoreductase n=1 Tax=Alteromonas arenosi TaxID=3055817 RepID=A0ABT7SXB1_9ALTE|nr:Gfo/Idh/MocA family oxidoreductase [Alteromonas sp. ASW11-36]MDM7860189.1 Gfo/Idh/MocA family oxidoreductase [Alteromonas sp. ASW11-36]